MKEQTEDWLKRICGHEGGYVNPDPKDDPGGETKWGISKRSYPHLNIKDLTIEQASAIYMTDFIGPLRLYQYPDGVAYQLLDFGVNSGPITAIKQLQQAVGVKDDGVVGPITRKAIEKRSDSDLVLLIIAERLDYMADCKNFAANARGWVRRMARNCRYGAEDTD